MRAIRYARINTDVNTKGVNGIRYALNDLYAEWEDGTWRNDSIMVPGKNGKVYKLTPEGDFNLWLTFGPCPPFVNLKMDGQDNGRMTVKQLHVFAEEILGKRSGMLKMFKVSKKGAGRKLEIQKSEVDESKVFAKYGSRGSHLRGDGNRSSAKALRARLEEEFPKIYKRFLKGEFTSITAAAIEAGIKTDPHIPLDALRRSWNRATTEERSTFKAWIKKAPKNGGRINPSWT